MLLASVVAQLAAALTMHGPAFLIPTLHAHGMSLGRAGIVAAAPTVGVMLTLVPWGYVVDRWGERVALLSGSAGSVAGSVAAISARGMVAMSAALLVTGACAASANAASGRIVVGWFPAHRRGLVMGIRQMAQPLGVGVGAVTLPVLAQEHGVAAALWVPSALAALALVAVLVVVVDPPRSAAPAGGAPSPYRRRHYLQRIHLVSVLLVVPQFVVWTYALAWLIEDRGWTAGAAGALVAASQVAGALGRIGAGHLSDAVGSRMRPLAWVALAAAATMMALGLAAWHGWAVGVLLLVLATTVTVADNGLAFTAVAEDAGAHWAGRALGVQNTAQFLAASVTAPVAGVVIGMAGYPAAFAAAGLFPLASLTVVPRHDARSAH